MTFKKGNTYRCPPEKRNGNGEYTGDNFFLNMPSKLRQYYFRENGEWKLTKAGEEYKASLR